MENLSAAWLYPAILIAGTLQAWGPPMNGALRNSLQNAREPCVVSSDRSCAGRFGDVFATTFADGRWPERDAVVGAFGRSRRRVCRRCRPSVCQQGGRRALRRAYDYRQHPHVARHRSLRFVRNGNALTERMADCWCRTDGCRNRTSRQLLRKGLQSFACSGRSFACARGFFPKFHIRWFLAIELHAVYGPSLEGRGSFYHVLDFCLQQGRILRWMSTESARRR
jgi:hypothetical protein